MASLRKMLKRDISQAVVDDILYEVQMGKIIHEELKMIMYPTKNSPKTKEKQNACRS